MPLDRREFLARAGLGVAAGALGTAGCTPEGSPVPWRRRDDWDEVREEFAVSRDRIHLAGLLLATHPAPVREAIARHRRGLDEDPVRYLRRHGRELEAEARRAAADYLEAEADEVALTDSTTMGLATVYNGVELRPGEELLTTDHDHYSTHESLEYRAARSGATLRKIPLYRGIGSVTEDEIVDALTGAVRPETRVVALTWVHSNTGLKIPLRRIGEQLAALNADRAPAGRALLCVDGVHALGVEDFAVGELGCDFFVAGTHKWLFGPRGTGIIWGSPRARGAVSPTIPTFSRGGGWGAELTPGGFHSFEHRWALAQAFDFHRDLGKTRVAERVHALARQCKEGLARIPRVRLHTPMDERLSAGIVCFDVEGVSPATVVARLREERIIASETPYTPSHARLAPGLLNSPDEIDYVLRAVRALA